LTKSDTPEEKSKAVKRPKKEETKTKRVWRKRKDSRRADEAGREWRKDKVVSTSAPDLATTG